MDVVQRRNLLHKATFVQWQRLKGKRILVTGATGLIGTEIIRVLLTADSELSLGLKIVAVSRSNEKLVSLFGSEINSGIVQAMITSVENFTNVENKVNYIIHGASQTASKEMIAHPVETIQTAVLGTDNLLKYAVKCQVDGFIYLSSMEVYGKCEKGHRILENEIGALLPQTVRNCYPLSKVMCENLCSCYTSEFGIPVSIVRLAQVFSEDVAPNDNRAIQQFLRCAQEGRSIVLKTKGETERSYIHVFDAALAIITLLLNGEPGEAYNAADEKSYCSIAELANRIATQYGVAVKYEPEDSIISGYPDTTYLDLDTQKLRDLGWKTVT